NALFEWSLRSGAGSAGRCRIRKRHRLASPAELGRGQIFELLGQRRRRFVVVAGVLRPLNVLFAVDEWHAVDSPRTSCLRTVAVRSYPSPQPATNGITPAFSALASPVKA